MHPDPAAEEPFATCGVLRSGTDEALASTSVHPGETSASLAFALLTVAFGLEFRCFSLGKAGFVACRAVILEEEPGDKGALVRPPATPGARRPGGNA